MINKVAVITGASKGIGLAIAESLAAAGVKVVVSSRKQDAVDEVANQLQAKGYDVLGVACNTGNTAEIQNLVDKTVAAFGQIDIIVNNAATNPTFGAVEFTDESAFDKIMSVNVKGPFELAKRALPYLKNSKDGGVVLNISSIGGISPEPQLGIYSVSKSALISLTKVLAKEWGAYNIRANVICPGLIKTKFSQPLWTDDNILKYALGNQPIARIGTVEEVASIAAFLCSPAASYCTGGVYTVDGGHSI